MKYDRFYRKIDLVQSLLTQRTPFAFARFGDGELGVIDGVDQDRPEWRWISGDPSYEALRKEILFALRHRGPSYYVGIDPSMEVILGEKGLQLYYELSDQDPGHVLTATLFVNQNYPLFQRHIVPLFRLYRTVVVCNRNGKVERLPFGVESHFGCGENAWINDRGLVDELRRHAESRVGYLYLFMVGPLSNILIHRLHSANPHNTYIDVGSPLDPYLFGRSTRRYLRQRHGYIAQLLPAWHKYRSYLSLRRRAAKVRRPGPPHTA